MPPTRLLNDFVPLPNSPGNRYIVSPTVVDNRDQFCVRFDYQLSGNQSFLGRYMRSDTERLTPRVIAAVDQRALATLQDIMVSHNYVISSNVINQARFSINRTTANPAVTSGLTPRDYGINLPSTNPLAVGLPSFTVQGLFGGGTSALGDPQQPFVNRKLHQHVIESCARDADMLACISAFTALEAHDIRSYEIIKIKPRNEYTTNVHLVTETSISFRAKRKLQNRERHKDQNNEKPRNHCHRRIAGEVHSKNHRH